MFLKIKCITRFKSDTQEHFNLSKVTIKLPEPELLIVY